jgi:hypothetical protein
MPRNLASTMLLTSIALINMIMYSMIGFLTGYFLLFRRLTTAMR